MTSPRPRTRQPEQWQEIHERWRTAVRVELARRGKSLTWLARQTKIDSRLLYEACPLASRKKKRPSRPSLGMALTIADALDLDPFEWLTE